MALSLETISYRPRSAMTYLYRYIANSCVTITRNFNVLLYYKHHMWLHPGDVCYVGSIRHTCAGGKQEVKNAWPLG